MGAPFIQIGPEQVRSGLSRPLAMFNAGADQLARRYGLRFRDAVDDLDELKIALLETPSRHQFALTEHKNAPEPGVVINVTEKEINLGAAWRELVQALDVQLRDMQWAHPAVMMALGGGNMKFAGNVFVVEAQPSPLVRVMFPAPKSGRSAPIRDIWVNILSNMGPEWLKGWADKVSRNHKK